MSKQKELSATEKVIKDYLDIYAKQDEAFAKNYAKENKSFDECLKYIKSEAKKQASNGCVMISDEEVYGWAVHYYDEDNIKVDQNVKAEMTTSAKPEEPSSTEITEKKRVARQSKRKLKEEVDPDIPAPLEIPLL